MCNFAGPNAERGITHRQQSHHDDIDIIQGVYLAGEDDSRGGRHHAGRPQRAVAAEAIREVAPTVQVGRQWFAVYRAMVQREVIAGEDYDGFVCLVKEAVPKHDHMTTIDELQRMAVESFTKPVGMWNPLKAPVQGKRFTDYQAIGLRTLELLMPKG